MIQIKDSRMWIPITWSISHLWQLPAMDLLPNTHSVIMITSITHTWSRPQWLLANKGGHEKSKFFAIVIGGNAHKNVTGRELYSLRRLIIKTSLHDTLNPRFLALLHSCSCQHSCLYSPQGMVQYFQRNWRVSYYGTRRCRRIGTENPSLPVYPGCLRYPKIP